MPCKLSEHDRFGKTEITNPTPQDARIQQCVFQCDCYYIIEVQVRDFLKQSICPNFLNLKNQASASSITTVSPETATDEPKRSKAAPRLAVSLDCSVQFVPICEKM